MAIRKKLENNVTIADAHKSISNAVKEYKNKFQQYPKINNYKDFLNRIQNAGYFICAEKNIRCPKGEHIAELFPDEKRIKKIKNNPNFELILKEYLLNNNNSLNKKENINSYFHLQNKIKKLEKELLVNWNGDTNDPCFEEFEIKIWELLNKFYTNYSSKKNMLTKQEKFKICSQSKLSNLEETKGKIFDGKKWISILK